MAEEGQSYVRRLIAQLRAVADRLEAEENAREQAEAEREARRQRAAFRVIGNTAREPRTVARGSLPGPS